MPDSARDHRHYLIRCSVENSTGTTSTRYVEEALFRLWQYAMTHKHGLAVRDPLPCLWLPAPEYESRELLFSRAGEVEPVTRIAMAFYESALGVVSTVQRFVAAADAPQLRAHLLTRIDASPRTTDDCAVDEQPGYAVTRADAVDAARIGIHFRD